MGDKTKQYMLGIDQSTQGTKAILFDEAGQIVCRQDVPHRQIINDLGWVSHDLEEIYANTLKAVQLVVGKAGIQRDDIAGVGISNQRETSAAWGADGKPVCNAIVWQCARAQEICSRIEEEGKDRHIAEQVKEKTGLNLSPYFPAAKYAWILENEEEAMRLCREGSLHLGTIDSFLIYRLTKGKVFRTDYSNASRTQLFNIHTLSWDPELCEIFGVPQSALAEVCDSDGNFGKTDFEGYLDEPIPICGVLGDSHAALFGQGCHKAGMVKATYGTGSSVMMNIGEKPVMSQNGLVTSLAWSLNGKAEYVLEGNLNYTGAVITWLKDDVGLISSPGETQEMAKNAAAEDQTYLVPAFSGLGAPYWDSTARASLSGMSRTTGRNEIVRAALDCIDYQITDILMAMSEDAGMSIEELRVDGGPTRNQYLMQFQSDIAGIQVSIPPAEELSAIGAAYCAGISLGFYKKEELFQKENRTIYLPSMNQEKRDSLYAGWKEAVNSVLKTKS